MMELKENDKYILHEGSWLKQVVTYDRPHNGYKVYVITKDGQPKLVSRFDLSEIPETKFSKISKWVGSTLITIAVKEVMGGIIKAFKK